MPVVPGYFKAYGLAEPATELRFAPPRRWRFDYAWPDYMVALEVDGAVWAKGRHTRGAGFLSDIEKLNEAGIMGWLVVRCTPQDIKSGAAVALVGRAIESRYHREKVKAKK